MESARTSAFKMVSSANIDECRAAVGTIRQKNVIALYSTDAYIDWPLKLLAVGTGDGNVYLFDILKNGNGQDRGLFKNSGLDEVLTSPEIVKVTLACNNISAALFFQFGIKMSNVFDVQVAHTIIREHNGKAGIWSTNLKNICNIYFQNCGTYKQTYFRLLQWGKKEGDFWTKRPLAQEKIDYACNEVSALIPELYEQQKRYLEDNGLTDGFDERVLEEIFISFSKIMIWLYLL